MKKLLILVLSICTISASAQFKLSGKVLNATKADTLYLNIPFIYGYYHDNDVAVPVDAKGNFNISLKLPQQKFATLTFAGKNNTLLLTPGKTLALTLNPADSALSQFTGTAADENKLLHQTRIDQIPFFSLAGDKSPYAKLNDADLQQQVVKPWQAMRDKNIAMVQASKLSVNDKKLIEQEIRANAITQLNFFARAYMDHSDRDRIFKFVLTFYKEIPLAPAVLPAGPQYYFFADSYISYYETLAFQDLPADAAKDPKTFLKYYNLTIDSGTRVAKQKGKAFLSWILVKNNYPKSIAENWLAQNVFTKCSTKDLDQAQWLMGELKTNYPHSKYVPALAAKMDGLEVILAKNVNNKDIVIADGYQKMTSIYQAISKLKGKVVYLDIWGTWCGPCKEQLRYNPAMKQYFKGKDVAFVYLDMDDDEKDPQWRNFIKVNGMTGLHLRKNRNDIQQIWAELNKGSMDKQYYPMYFIFDKNGKLVLSEAKEPGDKHELYNQIEQYLAND